jgi:RNA polymerase sigma-70 factor (sigma-E family)
LGESQIDPALAELCRTEHVRLVGLLALYVGDRHVAEDLAQETLVRLHQHWPRVREMAAPRAWLSRVGLNLARSWWRRHYAEQRAHRRVMSRASDYSEPEPADVLTVRAAVSTLPPRQRAALVMRYYAGLSVEDTAEALGCAAGTVKALTHRAIATLRTTLDLEEAAEKDAVQHA